jgi:hypothetical protein
LPKTYYVSQPLSIAAFGGLAPGADGRKRHAWPRRGGLFETGENTEWGPGGGGTGERAGVSRNFALPAGELHGSLFFSYMKSLEGAILLHLLPFSGNIYYRSLVRGRHDFAAYVAG